jgi:AmmeMemoRadiSam system protein A
LARNHTNRPDKNYSLLPFVVFVVFVVFVRSVRSVVNFFAGTCPLSRALLSGLTLFAGFCYTYGMNFSLTQSEKEMLLKDAREAIAARLEKRQARHAEADTAGVNAPCGAFVTLHKGKQLRGCIGRMSSPDPLFKTVRAMALEAAFGDPRFPPLRSGDLEACDIEISALSPLEECPDPETVQVGLHGLYLSCRGHSGVLLPQVPVEQGWDKQAFLDYICVKAGLPPGSYKDPAARLYTFTALVFGEEQDR